MVRVCLLLALLGTAILRGDSFIEKYAYSKIMRSCFGEEGYAGYEKNIHQDVQFCKKQVLDKMKEGKQPEVQINEAPFTAFFETFSQPMRPRRQATFDSELLKMMVKKVKTKAEILMCVVKKMKLLDGSGDINTALMKHEGIIGGFEPAMQKDLITLIDKCYDVSKCVEGKDSPLPIELQRIMTFFKCSKKGKVSVCMKADLRKHIGKFNMTGLSEFQGDENAKVEKLLHAFWGDDDSTDPLDLLA